MLNFYDGRDQNLITWAGVVQQGCYRQLYSGNLIDQSDIEHLSAFCFPTVEALSGPILYAFRFKAASGQFLNGFCLMDQTSFHLKEMDPNLQSSICLLSPFYFSDMLEEVLKIIRSSLLRSISHTEHIIENFAKNSGNSVYNVMPDKVSFRTQTDQHLTEMNSFIASKIDPLSIGHVILGILSDTSIIVVSSDLSSVSRFCFSLLSIIHPLIWHHIFIPVLPHGALNTIESPSPFIVGLNRQLLSRANLKNVEGHLYVDIDEGTVESRTQYAFPQWALNQARNLTTSKPTDLRAFIVQIVCMCIGVQPSSAPQTTSRRILSALRTQKLDHNSFAGLILSSRTTRTFIEALDKLDTSSDIFHMLAGKNPHGITSPAAQDVAEFPLRKFHVSRSMSSTNLDATKAMRSVSMPVITDNPASEGHEAP